MKEIKLSQQGKNKNKYVTQVDDDLFEYLNQWRWYAQNVNGIYYAIREDKKSILMHRQIMNCPDNMQIDHKDHNGLNNQKSNLRICTPAQNMYNRKRVNSLSGHVGVFYKKGKLETHNPCIRSAISFNNKIIHLGVFLSVRDAAIAYDIAALKYHKEYAVINFEYADWFKQLLYNKQID